MCNFMLKAYIHIIQKYKRAKKSKRRKTFIIHLAIFHTRAQKTDLEYTKKKILNSLSRTYVPIRF